MNDNSKHEIDELFSAAIDDALTQRQQTELKRLLQHQPEMAEQIEILRRQRQLLCSLPVETAPTSLAEDIRAHLERKLILDNAARMQGMRSRAALVRRRFVAAAAMLFLPLGLLGYVVYHIVTPLPDNGAERPTARELLKDDLLMTASPAAASAAAGALPFDGSLTLITERPTPTAQLIKKQIFLKALEHQTIPNQTAETITFHIDCTAEALADFAASLAPLWGQLSDSRLTLRDVDAPDRTVTIQHVLPEQIQRLALHTDKTPMLTAARLYASNNAPLRPMDATGENALPLPEELVIPQPILAWPQRDVPLPTDVSPTVHLTIELRQAE